MSALRGYQQRAFDDGMNFIKWEKGNGIINVPCGGGKSHLIAAIAKAISDLKGRVIVVADRKELIEQNESKFNTSPIVGVVSAGLGRKEYDRPIVIGGIQSIYDKRKELGDAHWLLIDECQGVENNKLSDSMYWQLIRSYPFARILGFSATPYRAKDGQLNWGKVIHETTYQQLWEEGWLARLTNKVCDEPDLTGVKINEGEYNQQQLAGVMNREDLIDRAVEKLVYYGQHRKKWLVYTTSIEHCTSVAWALHNKGIRTNYVHGEQPAARRDANIDDFKSTDPESTRCLVNVDILTKGSDFPMVDLIGQLRPTESMGLHEQILGRGVRHSAETGKQNCLILDFTGNLKKHGTLGNPTWKFKDGVKVTQNKNALKICPNCEECIPVFKKECPECAYKFLVTEEELKHGTEIDAETDLMNAKTGIKWYTPKMVMYTKYQKEGKKIPTLRVDYYCGNAMFSEFICIEHKFGEGATKAEEWMMKMGLKEFPKSIDDALKLEWNKPVKVAVRKNGRFNEITNYSWE